MRYLLTLTVAEMMKILKCHSQYRNRRCHKFQLGPGSINRTLLQFPNFSRFPYFPGKWSLDKIKKNERLCLLQNRQHVVYASGVSRVKGQVREVGTRYCLDLCSVSLQL